MYMYSDMGERIAEKQNGPNLIIEWHPKLLKKIYFVYIMGDSLGLKRYINNQNNK